jgi:PIN domain nuclease of toxin-antitoxin system
MSKRSKHRDPANVCPFCNKGPFVDRVAVEQHKRKHWRLMSTDDQEARRKMKRYDTEKRASS